MQTPVNGWRLICALFISTCAGASAGAGTATAAGLSPDGQVMLQWILRSTDNASAPFAIIDKRRAHLWLFNGQGQRVGSTAVLLGSARGDESVPGIGERPLKDVLPHERTTPAGRFVAEPGRNHKGEDIFWVDYDAAVSMHRVRATNPAERRLQRLASPTPADNRISFGCINVPAAFYDRHIVPLFAAGVSVVYLLPENAPVSEMFRSARADALSPPPR